MKLSATAKYTPRGDTGRFIKTQITPGVRASIEASCKFVVDVAKQLVPVDTGELRDSIGFSVDEVNNRLLGNIYANADHAGYVEFGTGRRGAGSKGAGPYPYSPNWPGMEARPYLRPALDDSRSVIISLFRSQIDIQRTPFLTGGPF